jgi:amino acid transporter
MTESANKTLFQYTTKLFLWLLRRPIGIWLVLLFSITSVITPISIMLSNSEQMISLMGMAQFTQLLTPHLFPALTCIVAGLLALFMKKESIILFLIYFLLYFLNAFNAFKVGIISNSNIIFAIAVQVVLGIFVIAYLIHLKRNRRLK